MKPSLCVVVIAVMSLCMGSVGHASSITQGTYQTAIKSARFPILSIGDRSSSVITLHQMLSRLGYLPVQFDAVTTVDELYPIMLASPSAGVWRWRFASVPQELLSLWDPTTFTVLTQGAVMTFERENQMAVDGIAGPRVFRRLQVATMTGMRCRRPYTYVFVRQSLPQTLTVWQEGKVVLTSLCSTGVKDARTHTGTFAIYLRNREQAMEGDGPSGKHYRVENVPYVNFFFNGEAIHGLKRPQYGMPQSVGCVELPIDKAKAVWEMTDYGTLVTVK